MNDDKQNTRPTTRSAQDIRPFLYVLALLIVVYALWLLTFWPGILGQDSLAIILQIEDGKVQSGKPVFWYLFVKWLYEPHRRIEVSVAVQLLIGALVFARILSWCWQQRMTKCFFFILFLISLGTPVLYYQSALYSDGLFCTAAAGLIFEAWRIVRAKRAAALSLAYLAVLAPIALFFRANGMIMLLLLIPLLLSVPRTDKVNIGGLFLVWMVLYLLASNSYSSMRQHGTLFPLAIFETVNFLQPSPTGLRSADTQVTPETLTLLESKRPLKDITAFYDRDYWDPLVYRAGGPAFYSLTKEEKKLIVREFFCCNLWKNIPAFLGSRVNIFMVSALAQGGFGGLDETLTIVPQTRSTSQIRPFDLGPVGALLRWNAGWSFSHRWILWTPFLGIGLVFALIARGWRRRDWVLVLLIAPMAFQLAGIFFFSVAGEFRYLMLFFTSSAALLPIYVATQNPKPGRL